MRKPYEIAVVVELGWADELVLGPGGFPEDNPGSGEQTALVDADE